MQEELIALLAPQRGHFQMESGYHSDRWFALDRVLNRRDALKPFIAELARRLALLSIDGVCGPMTGGARLARMIGDEMGIDVFSSERFETNRSGLFPVEYRLPAVDRDRFEAGRSRSWMTPSAPDPPPGEPTRI